jgi:hypothetical protein
MCSGSADEAWDLRARRLRKLGRRKRDDRHRADGDPSNRNARHATPGQRTSRTRGSNGPDDRVHIAQPRHSIANGRILRHTGLPEVSHAVLEVVLELREAAAAL